MRRTLLTTIALSMGTLSFLADTDASIVFTSNASYAQDNSPMFRGAGTWTVEQAPIGSGLPMPDPIDLITGFIGGRETMFRYVAAAEDVGTSVVVSWTIDRPFLAVAGDLLTDRAQFSLNAQLSDSKGLPASMFFEMATLFGNGGSSAIAYPGGTQPLSETGETISVAAEGFGTFSPTNSGGDFLRQSVAFSVAPTAAGQEFFIHLGGAVSEVISTGGNGTVPEVTSLVIWTVVGLIGVTFGTPRRRF